LVDSLICSRQVSRKANASEVRRPYGIMRVCGRSPTRGGGRKEISIVAPDGKGIVLLPGEGETVSLPGNKISFVHREPDSAY
jgi:hypothetical protein